MSFVYPLAVLFTWFCSKCCVECQKPLGMANGAIIDGQITASTEWDPPTHAARIGRLFHVLGSGGWIARTNDASQWIQIDLLFQHKVTQVATQGRSIYCCQWVTKYNLQHRTDGVNFQYYKEQGQTINKVKTRSSMTKLNKAPYSYRFHDQKPFIPQSERDKERFLVVGRQARLILLHGNFEILGYHDQKSYEAMEYKQGEL